jgi:hypothetical protein
MTSCIPVHCVAVGRAAICREWGPCTLVDCFAINAVFLLFIVEEVLETVCGFSCLIILLKERHMSSSTCSVAGEQVLKITAQCVLILVYQSERIFSESKGHNNLSLTHITPHTINFI